MKKINNNYLDYADIIRIAKKIEKGKLSETKELLMKTTEKGWTVSHQLANNSNITKWKTDNKEFLMLQDDEGWSVAHMLAYNSDKTEWKTNDKEILMLQDNARRSVAHILANNSYKNKWYTDGKDILMLQDNMGWSVAHELAYQYPSWTTHDLEILSLMNKEGKTVEDILKRKNKI